MNIGLTAHNSKKTLLESFCIAYKGIFKKHTLIATKATANQIASDQFASGSDGRLEADAKYDRKQ